MLVSFTMLVQGLRSGKPGNGEKKSMFNRGNNIREREREGQRDKENLYTGAP
jgi:hypothetical protein